MEQSEKPSIIFCGILHKEIEHLVKTGEIDAKVHYLSEQLHMDYNLLDRGLNGALKRYRKKSPGGIVVVYGDLCLGFNGEMKVLMDRYDAVKVDGLNCIDCLLGGKGKLLEIDPDHKYLFLNPAFLQFDEKLREKAKYRAWGHEMYSMLDGIILLDEMGDLADYQSRIDELAKRTGLPILDHRKIGLDGLKSVLLEALDRNRQRHTVNKEQIT
jgi:hypothetical protein